MSRYAAIKTNAGYSHALRAWKRSCRSIRMELRRMGTRETADPTDEWSFPAASELARDRLRTAKHRRKAVAAK